MWCGKDFWGFGTSPSPEHKDDSDRKEEENGQKTNADDEDLREVKGWESKRRFWREDFEGEISLCYPGSIFDNANKVT